MVVTLTTGPPNDEAKGSPISKATISGKVLNSLISP